MSRSAEKRTQERQTLSEASYLDDEGTGLASAPSFCDQLDLKKKTGPRMPQLKILDNIATIRAMLHDLERSAGLTDLSPVERDVLYAASSIKPSDDQPLRSDDMWAHELVRDVPEATFRRALRSLVERGLLKLAPGRQRGAYILQHDAVRLLG